MKKLLAAGAAIVLTTLALYAALPTHPASARTDRPVAARVAHTAVTLRVSGCEGCRITAHSWLRLHMSVWSGIPRTVHNGRVTVYPPTGRTRGLSLSITDPHAVSDGAEPGAVIRYAGVRAGTDVTPRKARRSTAGFYCWAGTTAPSATLRLTVDRYAERGLDGTYGYNIRVYGDPAIRSVGDRAQLHHGSFETQDVPPCSS